MTPKQKTLMAFIADRHTTTGVSPTYREMMNHLESKSFSSIAGMCRALIDEGYLSQSDRKVRSYEPTRKWFELRKRQEAASVGA